MKKILFVSGSLRKNSFNTALLEKAAAKLEGKAVCSFLNYHDIPYMNQDIEFEENSAVDRVRKEVREADAIWIGTPEYNHSTPGGLKNLLDWLSRPVVPGDYSTSVIRGKLTAMSAAAGSSAGSYAMDCLAGLLTMFSCRQCPVRTGIALAGRFSENTLILTPQEDALLEEECRALLEMLSGKEDE